MTPEPLSPAAYAAVKRWESVSFTSTLYLHPILDALLEPAPNPLHDELRLGLQEALVNAAKHGNHLDPKKIVSVRHAKAKGYYWWVVSDQGEGFERPLTCSCPAPDERSVSECGRGLFILHQVFDRVLWSEDGREVYLAKQVSAVPLMIMNSATFFKILESWWHRWSPTAIRSA